MKLIIVESPTKARTLTRFLGGAYNVEATYGHIRDLPKAALGVDIDHDFAPSYVTPRDKAKRVRELKKISAKAESIILATDPDREGEAIAFHVGETLRQKDGKTVTRIVFHEITESAIKDALEHPRSIDMQLVNAQQARRVLDRLVGYKLSPLLWQKLSRRWLSAGRVQSVAVRLVVEREREIQKFIAEEYWTIKGEFASQGTTLRSQGGTFAELVSKDGVKYEKTIILDLFDGKYTTTSSTINKQQTTNNIIADLKSPYSVSAVDKKEVRRYPAPPYTTSTLQQDAGRRLYFSAKRSMQLAQKLYEEGLITYHRTDSVNLAERFISQARDFIGREYGKDYVASTPRRYKTKSKVAQEAHEAIRPTKVEISNIKDQISNSELNRDHQRLYELIWKRAVATQAAEAVFDSTTIMIKSSNGYEFVAQGSVVKFEGFLKIIGRLPAGKAGDADEVVVPTVAVGQQVNLVEAVPTQHYTQPPPRYTEATLVKTLEEKDIGRPSTYAPIISTIQERQYVTREEKKLVPTELGNSVTDFLVQYFPTILDLPFTANLEASLDDIANGVKEWVPVIRDFYTPFAAALDKTYEEAERVKMPVEELDEICPECKVGNLLIRTGRYGKFIACSTFPKCKYTRAIVEKIDMKCPRDGGDIVIKKSKRGKTFYGCSNYPKCNFAAWKKEDIK